MSVHRLIPFLAGASMLALAAAAPVVAQELDIGEVVVTPNKAPTEKRKTGVKVDLVDRKTLDAEAKPALADYLDAVAGVHVASPGGAGQESSLSVRGADKKYVKTLWNGIDIADPSSTQVQVGFQHLTATGITGVEVLKGSQSTHYGSEAVAGVIAIDTLGGIDIGTHHQITLEAGSHGTFRAGYGLTSADDEGKAAFTLSGMSTNGFSSAAANGAAPTDVGPSLENDFYRNGAANFAFDRKIADNVTLFGAGFYVASEGAFDDSGYPPVDNEFNDGRTRQIAGRAGFTVDSLDGRLRNTFAVQGFDIVRDLHIVSMFGPFDARYNGKRAKAEYQGAFDATDRLTVQWGGDLEAQTAASVDNYGTDTSDGFTLGGIWAQAIVTPLDGFTLDAGVRHDVHSVFGGHTTWRLAGSYGLESGTRLHASVGTGYRAPSLYELYGPFVGNVALQPETSLSADAGVEQTWLDGRLVADVTAFMLNTDNLIDYSFATFRYEQIAGMTRRAGVETSLKWQASDWLDLTASYTFTRTRQPDGARRPRIPVHDFAIGAVARPAEKWEIAATARIALDTVDLVSPSWGAFALAPLDNYVLVDAKVSYKPNERTEIYLRGENLLNQRYQTVYGYQTAGIGVFAGLKAKF